MPEGTSIRVGASCSMRWRCGQSIADFNAASSSPSSSASSRVLPAKAGFSQSSSAASNAASERSGKSSSGSHTRRQRTRMRHCDRASLHGRTSRPSSRTASVKACAARSGSTRPADLLDSTMPSKRAMRSLSNARFDASQRTSSASRKCAVNACRRYVSSTGAARSSKASLASKRSSLATIHGSPYSAESSNSLAIRPFASR